MALRIPDNNNNNKLHLYSAFYKAQKRCTKFKIINRLICRKYIINMPTNSTSCTNAKKNKYEQVCVK